MTNGKFFRDRQSPTAGTCAARLPLVNRTFAPSTNEYPTGTTSSDANDAICRSGAPLFMYIERQCLRNHLWPPQQVTYHVGTGEFEMVDKSGQPRECQRHLRFGRWTLKKAGFGTASW